MISSSLSSTKSKPTPANFKILANSCGSLATSNVCINNHNNNSNNSHQHQQNTGSSTMTNSNNTNNNNSMNVNSPTTTTTTAVSQMTDLELQDLDVCKISKKKKINLYFICLY